MAYNVEIIGSDRAKKLLLLHGGSNYYRQKADINGICIELFTENKDFSDMWSDNFYHMSDHVRSHGRIYCINDGSGLHAEYDMSTYTMFLFDFDYYGWIKSVGLGMAGNILERGHYVYSVHGAAIDVDGKGVTLIAPSKTGKTTQSWGLLRLENSHLISDDWYFVQFGNGRPRITGSERNCYIDADIGDVWEEYKPLVTGVKFDNKGRGIGNVRWVRGDGAVIPKTSMSTVILLKRDPEDPELCREMAVDDALSYLESHDFCNPHQLIRDEASIALRREFFRRYLSECKVYMVNTTSPARETQERIRSLIG